jgi:hypothetical protein
MSRIILFAALVAASMLQGCALVRSIAGGNIDREQYDRAREAVMLEARYLAALRLGQRLQQVNDPLDADLSLILSENLIDNTLRQLRGRSGWLDRETPYVIDSIATVLYHGSGVASMRLSVYSKRHNVSVSLLMDCLLAFIPGEQDLRIEMEPFNVQPAVQAPGLLSIAEDIIADVIRVKLGSMKEEFPPVRLPLSFADVYTIDGTSNELRGKVNVKLDAPRRMLSYQLRIQDVLIFDDMLVLTATLADVRGR